MGSMKRMVLAAILLATQICWAADFDQLAEEFTRTHFEHRPLAAVRSLNVPTRVEPQCGHAGRVGGAAPMWFLYVQEIRQPASV